MCCIDIDNRTCRSALTSLDMLLLLLASQHLEVADSKGDSFVKATARAVKLPTLLFQIENVLRTS